MNEGTTISYPARPSQFLALLEQIDDLGSWEVSSRSSPASSYVAFYPRSSSFAKRHHQEHIVYFAKRPPVVQLGKLSFDLLRLFEKGQPWDPQVYTANPYMPDTAKQLLNQLFAVLVTVEPALQHAA